MVAKVQHIFRSLPFDYEGTGPRITYLWDLKRNSDIVNLALLGGKTEKQKEIVSLYNKSNFRFEK